MSHVFFYSAGRWLKRRAEVFLLGLWGLRGPDWAPLTKLLTTSLGQNSLLGIRGRYTELP